MQNATMRLLSQLELTAGTCVLCITIVQQGCRLTHCGRFASTVCLCIIISHFSFHPSLPWCVCVCVFVRVCLHGTGSVIIINNNHNDALRVSDGRFLKFVYSISTLFYVV